MSFRLWEFLLAVVFLGFIGLATIQAQDVPRSFSMGMAYWPPSGGETPDAVIRRDLGQMLPNTEIILVQIPWCPGVEPSQAEWMSSIARESDKELVIAVDWLHDTRQHVRCGEESAWTFADPEAVKSYQQTVGLLAHKYQPEYLLLGVEVDYYAVIAPDDFENFLTVYRTSRDGLKHIEPETQVGVSLQYEHMLRVEGDSTTFVQRMVSAFEGMSDFVGLAVYPFMAGVKPTKVDAEYFEPVSDLDVPLAVSETAWPGLDTGLFGVFGTQGPYMSRILEVSNELDVTFLLWAAMRDVELTSLNRGTPPWATVVGLWDSRGEPKPALNIWQAWLGRSWSAPH